MFTLSKLAYFLQNAHWPQSPERRPTFFSIAGFPHYENVMSNVYQFFFSTDEAHGLGSLCIDALGDVLHEKFDVAPWPEKTFRRTYACRELRTDNDKRLDILLHNGLDEDGWKKAGTTVLIENKVYHWLANDLGEYWQFVEQENLSCKKIGIVLGLKREYIPDPWHLNWVSITHFEWAKAVEKRLGSAIYRAEPRYITLLLELIENIRAMTNANENFNATMQFVQQNMSAIRQIEAMREQLFYQIPDAIREALPGFDVYSPKSGQDEAWLTIKPQEDAPLLYIVSYNGIIYPELEGSHSFTITLSTANNAKSDQWQQKLDAHPAFQQLIQQTDIKPRREESTNYLYSKAHSFNSSDYIRFPQLVAEKIRNDWQPLEKYWLDVPTGQT